jgi:hypothetical protein
MAEQLFRDVIQGVVKCLDDMGSQASADGLLFGLRGVPGYLYCLKHDPRFEKNGCATMVGILWDVHHGLTRSRFGQPRAFRSMWFSG